MRIDWIHFSHLSFNCFLTSFSANSLALQDNLVLHSKSSILHCVEKKKNKGKICWKNATAVLTQGTDDHDDYDDGVQKLEFDRTATLLSTDVSS